MNHSNLQKKLIFPLAFLLIACFLISGNAFIRASLVSGQENIEFDVKTNYDKAEYMIPMRDGVKLFTQVWVMTKGGPAGATSVMMELIYKNAFSYYRMGYASAISWILFVIIFSVTIVQNRMQKQRVINSV